MSIISGKIQEIYQGTVKSGRSVGSAFWSITLDSGSKLSTFEPEHVQNLEQGKEYTFDIETKGNFVNITAEPTPIIQVEGIGAPPPGKAIEISGKLENVLPNVTVTENTERTYKNRISALQAAVTYTVGTTGGIAANEEVIATAREFEAYIREG